MLIKVGMISLESFLYLQQTGSQVIKTWTHISLSEATCSPSLPWETDCRPEAPYFMIILSLDNSS